MKHWIVLGAACMALSGCTNAEWHSINHKFSPSEGDSRLIDAKQRAVISVVHSDGTYKGTCAEPSPDALQATAAALGGSGSLSKDDITAAVNLALNSTESAASIGLRTQSIQLLRDAYYRICEGYLSGGLDEVSYDVLQRRFQNHMIALMAVEQLTGVVKAEQVALTSQSAADAGAQLGVLIADLRKHREELNELNKRDQALADEIAKLEADIEAQGTPNEDEADEADEAAAEDEAAKTKKLEEDQAKLAALKSDKETLERLVADQEKAVATLQSAVDRASLKTITAESSTSAKAIGGGAGQARTLDSEVTKAVTEITLAAINSDYSGQVCTEALRWRPTRLLEPNTEFRRFCNNLLLQNVDARKKLTDAAIEIEKSKSRSCERLANATVALLNRTTGNITVEETNELLKNVAEVQKCRASVDAPTIDIKALEPPGKPEAM